MDSTSIKPIRQPVLIVGHHDGFCEVYAEKNIDVHFFIMPAAGTPRGEVLGEEYLELTTPKRFQALYRADRLRGREQIRKVTPAELAQQHYELDVLAGLNKASETLQATEVVAWTL